MTASEVEDTIGKGKTFAISPDGFIWHLEIEAPKSQLVLAASVVEAELVARKWVPQKWGEGSAGKAEQTAPAGMTAPKCEACDSLMKYREGTSKAGKPYKMWFCPKNKNHDPVWINDDYSEHGYG